MIAKRNLSPVQVARYTARPMTWALAWSITGAAVAVKAADAWSVVPFPVVGTLAAALAIFIAFRNNTAFNRWNEARTAWQSILVAARVICRQVVASTENAIASGSIDQSQADAFRHRSGELLIAFAWMLVQRLRPARTIPRPSAITERVTPELVDEANPPAAALVLLARHIKDGIRTGALGQFDPISLEPQMVALSSAQGVVERIATTPTLRQYDYFTRRGVLLLAAIMPFGVAGLAPDPAWLVAPLSLAVSGMFIVMAVTGAANDDPFANAVTDVPMESICTELERDVAATVGGIDVPQPRTPERGYLW